MSIKFLVKMATNITSEQKSGFIHQIRDQFFYIEIFLYNQLDGYNPFAVPFMFVNAFSIEETLLNWVTKGWIVINSDFEILERGTIPVTYDNNGRTVTSEFKPAPYVFRTDGRNKISFRIRTLGSQPNQNQNTYPDDQWELCYDFVIYDIEDLASDNNQKKLRKYYFWDERYQILSERNIEYSTVYTATKNVQGNIDYSTLPDIKKAANPNLVLQDILKTAASNPPIYSKTYNENYPGNLFVGFKDTGSIDDPTEPFAKIDNDNWDLGQSKIQGQEQNLVLYTSPANSNAIDDVEYVLNHCVSSDNGPVFLRIGRTSNDKSWKLESLSNYFKFSTNNQIERLYIEDGIGNEMPSIYRASTETYGNIQNYTSPVASRIQSYKFSPMVASDDMRITNSPVHNYDFSTGQFNIYFSNNRAIDVKNQMETYGKNGLFALSPSNSKNNGHALLTINKTKANGIQFKNNFVSEKFFPKNLSQIQMLKDALFLNEAVTFQIFGLTMRTPGKFLFIDRIGSNGQLNPFDDRFLGQWMILKVNHIFTNSTYLNEVVAVKVDSFSKLWDSTDNKY